MGKVILGENNQLKLVRRFELGKLRELGDHSMPVDKGKEREVQKIVWGGRMKVSRLPLIIAIGS